MQGRLVQCTLPLIICAVATLPDPLSAANSSTSAVIADVMIVTATRSERAAHDIPRFVDALDSDALRIGDAARTVPEALAGNTATMIQKTGHGQGSPYIRGFTGFRNLLLIDNVRFNNSVLRDGPNQYWNTVDPLTISRLEVVKGPSSSLYGSDAVGGTASALTRRREDYGAGFSWDRRLYSRYSSAENAGIGRAEISGNVNDSLGFLLGYSSKHFGELEGGRNVGTQPRTGYDENDWDLRIDYFFPDNESSLTLVHQGVNQDDAWRTHKTIYGISWEGTTVGNEKRRSLDQNRELTYLQYERGNAAGACERMNIGISHQHHGEERHRIRSDDRSDRQGFDVHTLGLFTHMYSPSLFGRLTYGAEAYRDYVKSFATSYNADGSLKSHGIQGPVADDATYDTLGIFVHDQIPLRESGSLTLGARYEHAAADADSVKDPVTGEQIAVSDSWNVLVGSARLMLDIAHDDSLRVFAGAAQGFRAPNLSDLTRLDSARSSEIETPSPQLDPERFVTYEAGMKARYENWSAQIACFYTDIDGMIVRTPTGRTIDGDNEVTKKNGGDGFVQGVEVEATWQFRPQLSARGNFTWMDGRVETYPTSDPALVEEPIDRLMPPTGRLGLKWQDTAGWWLEASCTIAAKADKLSTRDEADTQRIPPGGTPGYVVCDIRAGWRASDTLSLSAALENIMDEDYRVHGSGVNEPGRNFVLAADWAF